MNVFQTIVTQPYFPPLKMSFKQTQPIELSAAHMPFKEASDSTYHYTTLNPKLKTYSHPR